MTPQEYRGRLRGWGLTKAKPSYGGATIYQDRDGDFVTVPDPEQLLPQERVDFLDLIALRCGYTDPH